MLKIISDAEKEFGLLWKEAGYAGAAIASALKHDARKALSAGEHLLVADLDNFWITAKDEMSAAAKDVLAAFAKGGFSAALAEGKQRLSNINWGGVAKGLGSIGEATLSSTAHTMVTMVLSGLIGGAL